MKKICLLCITLLTNSIFGFKNFSENEKNFTLNCNQNTNEILINMNVNCETIEEILFKIKIFKKKSSNIKFKIYLDFEPKTFFCADGYQFYKISFDQINELFSIIGNSPIYLTMKNFDIEKSFRMAEKENLAIQDLSKEEITSMQNKLDKFYQIILNCNAIELEISHSNIDHDFFNFLPNKLELLKLTLNKSCFSNKSSSALNEQKIKILKAFPKGFSKPIKYIILTEPEAYIDSNFIKELPKSLTNLWLSCKIKSSKIFEQLPKALTCLSIEFAKIENLNLENLPTWLEEIFIKPQQLLDSYIKSKPYKLKNKTIPNDSEASQATPENTKNQRDTVIFIKYDKSKFDFRGDEIIALSIKEKETKEIFPKIKPIEYINPEIERILPKGGIFVSNSNLSDLSDDTFDNTSNFSGMASPDPDFATPSSPTSKASPAKGFLEKSNLQELTNKLSPRPISLSPRKEKFTI